MDGSYGGHSVGEKFFNKRLLSYAGLNKHNQHTWVWGCLLCEAESGPSTISHMRRSARCLRCTGENTARWTGHREITGTFLNEYRWNAKKRGLEWDLAPEYLWDIWTLQDGHCVYTGWKLDHGETASLDRIDNTKGYIPGNVQWVHRDINRMKSDFPEELFLNLCKAVAERKHETR